MPDDEKLSIALYAAARNGEQQRIRREMCSALAVGFNEVGKSVRSVGSLISPQRVVGDPPLVNGDDALVALGFLAQAASSLIAGACTVHREGNLYAAAALNRQLVEVEYLSWAFSGEDFEEASRWLRSTKQERWDNWRPKRLVARSRGRFRGGDYQDHCDVGGHPTPFGLRALHRDDDDDLTRELIVAETATHGTSTWDYLLLAIVARCLEQGLPYKEVVPGDFAKQVGDMEGTWRRTEQLIKIWGNREAGPLGS